MTGTRSFPLSQDLFTRHLAARGPLLTDAGRRVAAFIDQNRAAALASSAANLAASTGTSDATVIRTIQALGFTGMGELKRALVDSVSGASTQVEDMRQTLAEVGQNASHAIDLVLQTHSDSLRELQKSHNRDRIAAAVKLLHPAERIVVFGIGPSGPLALYATLLLERAGRPSKAITATGIALADQLLGVKRGDALLALAYGKPYREAIALFTEASRLRLPAVLVTDTPDNLLSQHAKVVVTVQRGRSDRMALHGMTLVALEAVILGLTSANGQQAMTSLTRLTDLREAVGGRGANKGED